MSAQIVEKKKRAPKKSVAIKVVPAPVPELEPVVVEPVAEPEPIVVESVEVEVEKSEKVHKKRLAYDDIKVDVEQLLNHLLEDIEQARSSKNKELLSTLKVYEKYAKKIKSNVKKLEPKDKKVAVRTQPSGFNKPLPVSAEIADFAGWKVGDRKSRTDVTVALCEYVKKNSLQQPECKKNIIPDKKLAALLRYDASADKPLTYSTMQKYIGHLFLSE